MPKRDDLKSILVIGSGPIVIGQACEFDYAGTQACIALREEGYKVILVNSNPATIMTDPEFSDVTYIEPLTVDVLSSIIAKERPDALLPTMGGQTALNLAVELEIRGILAKYGVSLIGANIEAIRRAEDRKLFHQTMLDLGIDVPRSKHAKTMQEAQDAAKDIGLPLIIRPSFTLGGSGCGIASDREEFIKLCEEAFRTSPFQELTLDEALIGWKEYEMEVVRDTNDNCIVVCSIENLDPLGIHTGDSITVAPIQTLTDKEYQEMRNISFAVLRTVGVETGGANVQFGVHPQTGRMVVIEMNPRVSRSSALASKATGFPIAKIAAKLAVGYTLDELKNDLTDGRIPASFEPVIDYVVVKIPRFDFEKFPGTKDILGPQMRSVGEVMAIGRNFSEALLKAMRCLEISTKDEFDLSCISTPNSKRLWHLFTAFRQGMSVSEVYDATYIDPWFLEEIQGVINAEKHIALTPQSILKVKRMGFSDTRIADLLGVSESDIRNARARWNIKPVFKRIDSCSAEFSTSTAYSYATYEQYCEASPSNQAKVMILGSGSNCIGQGIEFDYCCVHAVKAFKEMKFETIMVNCNPGTVSTDYDCADRLYFSPLTIEDLLPIIEIEKPIGILLQFGGQTSLNLAQSLEENNVPFLGFSTSLIDICENRMHFRALLEELHLKQPENIIIYSLNDPLPELSYPLIVRPSFVLGGRGMRIVKNKKELELSLETAFHTASHHPVLIERFLHDAIEIEIDAISDGKEVFIPAIMEQVEYAGIHSGDSASYLPTLRIQKELKEALIKQTEQIALKLKLKGLINMQFAIQQGIIYVLEINPRASRTIPFLSKAVGIDLVKVASRCIMDFSLQELGYSKKNIPFRYFFVKEAVFPYAKFKFVPLGPEMKSTGEVMGMGSSFQEAYAKALIAAGNAPQNSSFQTIQSLQEIYRDSSLSNSELQPCLFLAKEDYNTRKAHWIGKVGLDLE